MRKRAKSVIAENIRKKRKALGYKSAEKFAEFVGIPYGTLRDIEAGYSEGWFETREKIADALGCAVRDLYLSGDVEPASAVTLSDLANKDTEILEAIRRLQKPADALSRPTKEPELFKILLECWDKASETTLVGVAAFIASAVKHEAEHRLTKRYGRLLPSKSSAEKRDLHLPLPKKKKA